MKAIVVVIAPSRSGKDTLAQELDNVLQDRLNVTAVNFKWSDHVKRVVEYTYGLRPGALEDAAIRNSFIDGSDSVTYLDILISFYHTQDAIADEIFWKRPQVALLDSLMKQERTIISTDTRDNFEADTILELCQYYGYSLLPVKLQREGTLGRTSDHLQHSIYNQLSIGSKTRVEATVPDSQDYRKHLKAIALKTISELQ